MLKFWEEMEPVLREQAYRTIDHDPRSLLEVDGGPEGLRADVYMARLLGLDDDIVKDGWRLPRAEPHLRLPLFQRVTLAVPDEMLYPTLRTARYELQSSFCTLRVAAEYLPPDVKVGPDFVATFAYLRYRRRI